MCIRDSSKYLERHKSILRILFLEILSKYNLLPREGYAWYKRVSPKPIYKNEELKALWDVHLFAEQAEVRANCINVHVIGKVTKEKERSNPDRDALPIDAT